MKHGFVKAAAITPKLKVADVTFNVNEIKKEIAKNVENGVEILVFPELCLCGYTCGDLFLQPSLVSACKKALVEIATFTNGITALVFVGLPFAYNGKLYNVAAAVQNGKILAFIPKTNLPNYAEMNEQRYFATALSDTQEVDFYGETVPFGTKILICDEKDEQVKVGCEICEDLWVANSPCLSHASAGATIVVNLSASSETVGKAENRRLIVSAQSHKCACAYVYANAGSGESTTDVVFAGHNLVAEKGKILAESKPFTENPAVAEIDVSALCLDRMKTNTFTVNSDGYTQIFARFTGDGDLQERKISRTPFVPVGENAKCRAETVFSIQANALKKRLEHTNAKTAVIGVSGGLDSTLALLVVARAFDLIGKDRKDIVAVTMPGFGTTGKTYENALKLIDGIGATKREISIRDSVLQHFKDIEHDENCFDVTYENAQARMRTLILMDIANQTGGLVIGTGDLSELALGWCTYSGDQMSMYGVNCSVPKTLVKYLVGVEAENIGGETQGILTDILQTEISPELLPPDQKGEISQKTEDLVGPYELHDFYLYRVLRYGDCPEKAYYLSKYAFQDKYTDEELKKWLKNFYKRFFAQQFKRSCAPDGVKVGAVGLSPRGDFKMPSDAVSSLWLSELEKI
ncbi:MAG: NAD(+) synthase [Clostridia bacterium]|nr:NAD(+) synthase [Clostridia bacterium]